jgi:hypothetical protein
VIRVFLLTIVLVGFDRAGFVNELLSSNVVGRITPKEIHVHMLQFLGAILDKRFHPFIRQPPLTLFAEELSEVRAQREFSGTLSNGALNDATLSPK